jgi:universal stress protein A
MFKNILVPIDFSEYTEQILIYAKAVAVKFGSTLHLLHIVPNMDYFTPYESFMAVENMAAVQKNIEEEVEKDLEDLKKKIADIPVTTAIKTGVAFVEIIDYVKSEGIDLIVMGTHGRGALEHILIGGVAEKVVRKAPCPVLTIRATGKQFKMP